MPTRATNARTRARKTTRTVRTRSSSKKKKAPSAVTVAAKQIRSTVKGVRRNHAKLKIGTAVAVAAGVVTAGLLLRRKKH